MTEPGEAFVVGLGEMVVRKDGASILTCVGLGSCIAMCAYDPVSKVGGMAHMVLPGSDGKVSPKYVDTGVQLLLDEMDKQGAARSRLVVKIAGGAQMLSIPGMDQRLNVADRNIAAVKEAMALTGIRVAASDVGGNSGRTVQISLDSGKVMVRTAGGTHTEL